MLTTNKLDHKIAVTDDFVAYPIDWELEGNELETIFAECGVQPAMIASWREKEWI